MTPASAPPADDISPAEIAAAAKALGATGGGTGTARLLSLLYDSEVDVAEVMRCLSAEPALAARVLKVANSPFYRRAGTVGTVDRAVQVLGLAAIRGIAAAGCMDRISVPALGRLLDAESFRRHSLAVAVAAQALSARARCGVDGEAFMAGLLHDIGIVLLARLRPQVLADALAEPSDAVQPDHPRAARPSDGGYVAAHHPAWGTRLVEAWGLPPWLGRSIEVHHAAPLVAPDGAPLSGIDTLPALLALGDGIAAAAGFGLAALCDSAPAPDVAAALGLEASACNEVAAGLPEAMQRLLAGM